MMTAVRQAFTTKGVALIAILVVIAVVCVGIAALWVVTSPLTGAGVKIEKMAVVESFSFPVDEQSLKRAETTLMQVASENKLRSSRLNIPANGRQAVLVQITTPDGVVISASNHADAARLDVRVTSAQPREGSGPFVRKVQLRLQQALGASGK